MAESTTPVAPATPAESAPAEAAKAEVEAEARRLKVPVPDVGDVEIPEEEAVSVLAQFAKMTREDFAAKKKLEELEPAFDDEAKLKELLKKRGKDPAKLAEAWLAEALKSQVEEATLTPEQKRVKELEAKLAEKEAREKAIEEQKAQEKLDAETKEWFGRLQETALAALKETSIPAELQSHPDVLKRLGALMKRNAEKGWDIPPVILGKQLEAALQKEHDYVFSKLTPESLYKRLGRKGIEALIKLYANELKPKAPEAAALTPAPQRRVSADNTEPRKRNRYEEVREEQRLLRSTASGRENRYYGKG